MTDSSKLTVVTMAKSTLLKRVEEEDVVLYDRTGEKLHSFDLVCEPTRNKGEVSVIPVNLMGELFLSVLVAGVC